MDWQPIETAPRDYSPILIAYKSGEGPKVREARWADPFGRGRWETWLVTIDDNSPDILGWKPLPDPPTDKIG